MLIKELRACLRLEVQLYLLYLRTQNLNGKRCYQKKYIVAIQKLQSARRMARGLTLIDKEEGKGGHDLYCDGSLTACPMRSCIARETAQVY
jgi:hypothetical protein